MIIYDCEIENMIPSKDTPNKPNLKYCRGWYDHRGMGISVIGVYDYHTNKSIAFTRENFMEFLELITARSMLVSFNGIGFDNKLCRAFNMHIPDNKCYDILYELWEAAGPGQRHKGFKLDQVCKTALGLSKSGSGEFAPELWQTGQRQEVIDYCLHDVMLTKKLMDYLLNNHGDIPDPRDPNNILKVRLPT